MDTADKDNFFSPLQKYEPQFFSLHRITITSARGLVGAGILVAVLRGQIFAPPPTPGRQSAKIKITTKIRAELFHLN